MLRLVVRVALCGSKVQVCVFRLNCALGSLIHVHSSLQYLFHGLFKLYRIPVYNSISSHIIPNCLVGNVKNCTHSIVTCKSKLHLTYNRTCISAVLSQTNSPHCHTCMFTLAQFKYQKAETVAKISKKTKMLGIILMTSFVRYNLTL